MLSLLLLTPLLGALAVATLPQHRGEWARRAALAVASLTLMLALGFALRFDPAGGFQFAESHAWNPRLGSAFSLALDGLALAMVLLASLLFLVALAVFRVPRAAARLHYMLLLALEAAALGVFMARDWSLFYVFWELTLIPLFFLIERLGGARRQQAALNFVLYTLGGSVFMLVALLLLYDAAPGHSFDMAAMAAGGRGLGGETQVLIFLGLFLGFAVKMGIFPLHGWVPLVYAESPPAVPLISSGVLLKMGAYGVLRAIETLPGAAQALSGALSWLALASLVYAALLAWRQRELIGMAAYASISHMALVLLGAMTLAGAGFSGAMLQMLAHGLAAGVLFLLVGLLAERGVPAEGMLATAPRFAALLIAALLLALGLPGSFGFVAEIHVLAAAWPLWGGRVVLVSLALLVGAAWVLRELTRITGMPPSGASVADLGRRETLAAAGLLLLILAFGVAPGPLLALTGDTAARMARLFVPLP